MLDGLTRTLLLAGLVYGLVFAVWTLRQISPDRPSRKISIRWMLPTLLIWIVFEVDVLLTAPLIDGSLRFGIWLSRLGVASTVVTFHHQLLTIYRTDRAERRELGGL